MGKTGPPNVFVEHHLKSIFHPIMVILLAFGIDVKRRPGKVRNLSVLLAIFFHAVWISVSVNAVVCFDKTDVTYHTFTIIKYVCSLISWWILYKKRDDLVCLVSLITRLRVVLGARDNVALRKWIRWVSLSSLFIVFGPGTICCIKLLIADEYPMFFCSYHQNVMTNKSKARIFHFWLLSGFNYISRGLPFVVTILYSFVCFELRRLAKRLRGKSDAKQYVYYTEAPEFERNNNNNNNTHVCKSVKTTFFRLLELISELEGIFSSLVFLQFVNAFLEILRIETVILMYLKGRWHFDIIIHSIYYSVVGASSFLVMIFGADLLQSSCHAARLVLREDITDCKRLVYSENHIKSLMLQVEFLQDVRYIRLTAWGMFQVKRDLLLSILALYISYGVLIAQITP